MIPGHFQRFVGQYYDTLVYAAMVCALLVSMLSQKGRSMLTLWEGKALWLLTFQRHDNPLRVLLEDDHSTWIFSIRYLSSADRLTDLMLKRMAGQGDKA